MIGLTEKKWQELASDAVVVDPKTKEEYVLIADPPTIDFEHLSTKTP
jgi:hypothetical protein